MSFLKWVYEMFMTHPRIMLAALLGLIVLVYLVYRYLKKHMPSLSSLLPSMNKKKTVIVSDLSNEPEEKIAGLDSQLDVIYRQVTMPRSISEQLRKDLEIRNVKGIILYGPPGNGKTLLARNLAKKLGCHSFQKTSASALANKYYGETESNLRELFKHEPGKMHMVVLDEIDSICPIRKSNSIDGKFYTSITNQLLELMDGIDGNDPDVIVVGTTNNLDSIDPAILRPGRFDLKIDIGHPDEEARKSIFKVYTKHLITKGLMEDFNLDMLLSRTVGYSGADIENLIRKAKTKALYRHVQEGEIFYITEEDIMSGI